MSASAWFFGLRGHRAISVIGTNSMRASSGARARFFCWALLIVTISE
jgi:hypothetical protein